MSEFRKYGTDPKMDAFVDSEPWPDRQTAARQCYGLDKLINDRVEWVRETVAEQGYGLDILINDETERVRYAVAKQGYGLDILINDKSRLVREAVSRYLEKHNYKSISDWVKADAQDFKVQEDLKDFIYKIDDSSKLKVESSYDNVDEFFNAHNSNSDDFDELIICAVDTKTPIIKIQKTTKENKTEFKFLVDITDEEGDRFLIQTAIKSKEQLNTKIQETVGALRLYKEFSKYADDLEDCL